LASEVRSEILSQPGRKEEGKLLTKKSSAAVSSWGFSGYITVLPKESKAPADKREKEELADNSGDKKKAASNGR
jgi:hypothetical protein